MSMCYWAISGYGVENIEDLICEDKMRRICEAEEDDEECLMGDFLLQNFKSEQDAFYFTTNNEGEYYYLYSPSLPCSLTNREKSFTSKEDIIEAMFNDVEFILQDNITLEDFKSKVDWVSTYGAG